MQGKGGAPAGRIRDWVRRHPLFVAALWIVFSSVLIQVHPYLLAPSLLVAGTLGSCLRLHWWSLAWLLLTVLAIGIGHQRSASESRQAAVLAERAVSEHAGVVLSEPRGDEQFWQAPVRLDEGRGKVWWQGRGALPVEGSRVSAMGRFERPQEPRNPGEFDRRKWLKQQGMQVIFRQQPQTEGVVETGWGSQLLADARSGMRGAIIRGLDEDGDGAKVIRAVVLGDKPRDDQDLLEDFRHSGSMHVFSVSGLHVGMVAVLVWLVAAWTGLSRRWLVIPVIALVFAYAWLTGANAPAVRAAWMAAVFLGAFCFRRRPDLPNALGAVLLVLLIWDVRQLMQPSVQLSYGVVTAIAFGLPWTTRWFSRIGAAPMHMPMAEIRGVRLAWWRLRQWLATTLSVSVAASLGAAPLTLWHFGLVTPVSVIAALLMLPLVFAVMALAMLSVLISPIEPLGSSINRLNGCMGGACAKVAGWMAEVPGGHWQAGSENGPVLWVYDLQHGDGAAVWLPEEHGGATLIDCGGRSSFRHPLRSSLDRLGIEPDSLVMTHPDGGHVGGGHAVWRDLPIRQVLMPVDEARSPAYRAWSDEALKDGVELLRVIQVMQGLQLSESARLEWLQLPDFTRQDLAADHRVLVMRLHWMDWKILWLSDAGSETERKMLESGVDLGADVIVAGRHRSDLSLTDGFVEAVGPQAIIIDNDPHPEGEGYDALQVQAWRDAGITVFDQRACGAVSLRPDGDALLIEGFVNEQQLRLK